MGLQLNGPFRIRKVCTKRTCKYKITQSINSAKWEVDLWIQRGTGDIVLYAEMAGSADSEQALDGLFNEFTLGLEP